MKKYILISLLLAFNSLAAENISGKIGADFSLSYGIEGLDLNIDKERTIKMLMPRDALPNEVIPKNFDKFLHALKFENRNDPIYGLNKGSFRSLNSFSNSNENSKRIKNEKEDIKSVLLRGIVIDTTLLDLELDIKEIGTKIGTKIKGTPIRYGSSNNKGGKIDRALIYTDTDTKYLKMVNKFYGRATNKKVIGLDKFYYDDIKTGASFEFESVGKITPYLKAPVIPELSYSLNLSKENKYFSLAPGASYKVIDKPNEVLEISANYHVSNYEKDILTNEELIKDIESLSPGYDKVDYFKKFILGPTGRFNIIAPGRKVTHNLKEPYRQFETAWLDGKNGSMRSVGMPTGSLYGDNAMKIITQEALKTIINEMERKGLKKEANELLTRIRDKNKDFKYDYIKKLLDSKPAEKYKPLLENFDSKEKTMLFFEDAIQNITKELGLKSNEDISSFDLINYIPDNLVKYLITKENKDNLRSFRLYSLDPRFQYKPNGKVSIGEDLEYLFPDDYISPIYKAMAAKFIVDDSLILTNKVMKEINPTVKEIQGQINGFNRWKKQWDGCKWWEIWCEVDAGGAMADYVFRFKRNMNGYVSELDKVIQANKPKLLEIRSDIDILLDNLTNYENREKAKQLKNEIDYVLTLFDDFDRIKKIDFSSWSWGNLKSIYNEVKNIKEITDKIDKVTGFEKSFIDPTLDFVKPVLSELVENVDNMLNAPHKIKNFDMFAGLNVYKTEYDVKKEEYAHKVLKNISDIKDTPVGNGFNFNLNYINKKYNLQTNINVDDTFTKYMNKFSLNTNLKYSHKILDLESDLSIIDRQINYPKIKYNKLNLKTDLGLKVNVYNNKKNFLFKPGILYSGEFQYIKYISGGENIKVFKRDKNNMLIKKEGAPEIGAIKKLAKKTRYLPGANEFNNAKAGDSIDISKFSKYIFKEDYEKYFETEYKSGQSRWLKSNHYIVPSMDLIYSPIKALDLKYNLTVPIKLNSVKFDGILIKNTFGLEYRF